MRTSSCVTILFILGLVALGADAQTFQWTGLNTSYTLHVYGAGASDLPPQMIRLGNPLLAPGDTTGRVHTPVTITPATSNNYVTVSPNPIVLSDANNFQALVSFLPTANFPSNWSDSGVVISWTVSPNPNYTQPPGNVNLTLQPNFIEICVDDGACQAPGVGIALPPLLVGYPSRPITVRAKVPPPDDFQIALSSNGTTYGGQFAQLTFTPAQISLTPSQPWATFTATSTVFPHVGYGVMNIVGGGSGGRVFQPLPTDPAATAFNYTTRQIASHVPSFNGSTPLTLYVGVPTQIAVHLEYPLPSGTANITVFSQGDALFISGPAVFTAGTTIAFINVTATKYVAGALNIFFQTSPPDWQTGPITPPANLTVQIARRSLTTNGPVANATGPGRVFLGEPFPLSFELPFTTPNFVEFSVSGPTSGNTATFSFDRNIVRLDSNNTNAIVYVTPTQWVAENADESGDSFSAVIAVSLLRTAGSDWQLYEEPGDIELAVSRRSFYVPDSQSDGNNTIRLHYGQTSRPILVSVPWFPTLQNLVGDVVLTPYTNTQLGFTRFNPPFLTWNKNTPSAAQNITVTVLPQSDKIGVPAAFSVNWILSGGANDVQWFAREPVLTNFPAFVVGEPAFHFWTPGSLSGLTKPGVLAGLRQLVGETVTVVVAPEELPPTGVTLTIFCPDASVTVSGATPVNSNTASITFGPTGPLNAQFQITPQATEPSARIVSLQLSGPDAAFYLEPDDIGLNVTTRTLTVDIASGGSIPLGHVNDRAYVYLTDLPQNDLTVSIVPTSAASANAFTFTPNSLSFGPATPYSRSLVAQANALGTYTYNIQLGGTDAKWYSPNVQQLTLTGTLRDAPQITLPSMLQLIPGLQQGPCTVTLNDAPDTDLTVTPHAGDWTFTPPTVSFIAGQLQAVFSATYTPEFVNIHTEDAKTQVFFTLSGTDAWKYAQPAPAPFLSTGADIAKRSISFDFTANETDFVVGVPTVVRAFIDGPSPLDITVSFASVGFSFNPAQVTIAKGQLSAWFTVTATAVPTMWFDSTQGLGSSSVRVFFALSNEGASLFDVPPFQDWDVSLRGFLYDVMQPANGVHILQNTPLRNNNEVLTLGKRSSLITVTAQVASTASVTLTPSNPYLSFEPAQLTFSPGVLSVPFAIIPQSIPPRGRPTKIDWLLSGPDAALYTTMSLPSGSNLFVIPQLNFTFPSAIYIDGQATVTVTVLGTIPSEGFTLHVDAGTNWGIAIEPSALNFGGSGAPAPSPATPAPNGTNTTSAPTSVAPQPASNSRNFTIKHLRPSQVPLPNYQLTYTIKYGGYGTDDIVLPVGSVPLYASVVHVLRYGIVPDFPFTLGYRNCKASINITRAPLSTLLITPSSPIESNVDAPGARTDGNKDPAGRVIFTPPVLVFPPGQRVANFLVRIDRRLDDAALYYRIDYQVDGISDDTKAYLPFLSTWHVGAASAQQVVLLLAVALPMVMALLM